MKKLIYLVSFVIFVMMTASCGQQTCPSYANYYRSVAGKKPHTTSTKTCPAEYRKAKKGKMGNNKANKKKYTQKRYRNYPR
jgi:hypothetical protein